MVEQQCKVPKMRRGLDNVVSKVASPLQSQGVTPLAIATLHLWDFDETFLFKAKRSGHGLPLVVSAWRLLRSDQMAQSSIGLWEMLTNEEVVGLVGQWLDAQGNPSSQGSQAQSWLKSWWSTQKQLPVEQKPGEKGEGQRAPIRQQQWGTKTSLNERFVVEDKNAATHLVRNALGGKDQDQLSALLTLPSPFSRRYRDDLTVEVIFFGEGTGTGNVTRNQEASAAEAEAKAKL